MTDPILRRLELLRGYVAFLRERQDTGLDELVEDPELEAAIERYFQKAIEACIDIADRIIAKEGLPRAETYREAILALGKAGILERGFAEDFSKAAGFRNILVHDYTEVAIAKVHEALGWLDDFDTFARAVAGHLQRGP